MIIIRDLLLNGHGDLVIDPATHDLAIVDGIDEVAQRKNIAQTDMVEAIERNVPEVDQVTDINFKNKPNRLLEVTFKANVTLNDGTKGVAQGGMSIGD